LYFNIFNETDDEKTVLINSALIIIFFFQDVGMALFRRNKILTFYKAILLWYDEPKIAIENALILACMEIHRWPLPSTQKLV
jgi:hypothetical protein